MYTHPGTCVTHHVSHICITPQLGVKAAPYRKDFLILLAGKEEGYEESVVVEDIVQFTHSLTPLVDILNQFYVSHNLELPPVTQ